MATWSSSLIDRMGAQEYWVSRPTGPTMVGGLPVAATPSRHQVRCRPVPIEPGSKTLDLIPAGKRKLGALQIFAAGDVDLRAHGPHGPDRIEIPTKHGTDVFELVDALNYQDFNDPADLTAGFDHIFAVRVSE